MGYFFHFSSIYPAPYIGLNFIFEFQSSFSTANNDSLCPDTYKYKFHMNCLEHSIRISLTSCWTFASELNNNCPENYAYFCVKMRESGLLVSLPHFLTIAHNLRKISRKWWWYAFFFSKTACMSKGWNGLGLVLKLD